MGGGSMSTAGGIRGSSFMALCIVTLAFLRGSSTPHALGRSISRTDVLKVLSLAFTSSIIVTMFIERIGRLTLGLSPGAADTNFVPGRGADFNDRSASATPPGRTASPDNVSTAIEACTTHLCFTTGVNIAMDGSRRLN